MKSTLLDFSRRAELGLHATVVADVQAAAEPLGLAPMIVGAFARDLHLVYAHGIATQRLTDDIDLALAVPDWLAFERLHGRLVASGAFKASPTAAHRLRHRTGLPIDVVPFGSIEGNDRTIAWPPRGEIVMDVFGFREAELAASDVVLTNGVRARLASLPALALLKLVCWKDRHYQAPRKDSHDLMLIVTHYLDARNQARLFDDFAAWTQEDDFDYERAGTRMLGHDMRSLLSEAGLERVANLLAEQSNPLEPAVLPTEMDGANPARASALLRAVLVGLIGR